MTVNLPVEIIQPVHAPEHRHDPSIELFHQGDLFRVSLFASTGVVGFAFHSGNCWFLHVFDVRRLDNLLRERLAGTVVHHGGDVGG